jgi:GT2 family glycosyltransferase
LVHADEVTSLPDAAPGAAVIPHTAAVIIAWREAAITLKAVASVTAMAPRVETVICVAMEWSHDEVAALQRQAPSAVVLDLDQNLGFPAAANRGFEEAVRRGVQWALLLNNDATVDPQCLERCLSEAQRFDRVAVVGPAIAFEDHPDRLWYAGGRLSHAFAFTQHPGLRASTDRMPPSADTDYVTGCCALVSMAAWQAVGPYREDYFLYFEDPEWCARARHSGWRCRYLAEVHCYHAVSASVNKGSLGLSPTTAYYLSRNPVRFAMEARPTAKRVTRLAGLVVVWNGYNAWRIIRSPRRFAVTAAYVRGWRDGIAGRMGRRHDAA